MLNELATVWSIVTRTKATTGFVAGIFGLSLLSAKYLYILRLQVNPFVNSVSLIDKYPHQSRLNVYHNITGAISGSLFNINVCCYYSFICSA